jgi:hypothetical protein
MGGFPLGDANLPRKQQRSRRSGAGEPISDIGAQRLFCCVTRLYSARNRALDRHRALEMDNMRTLKLLALAPFALAVACGGSEPTPATPSTPDTNDASAAAAPADTTAAPPPAPTDTAPAAAAPPPADTSTVDAGAPPSTDAVDAGPAKKGGKGKGKGKKKGT